MWVVLAHQVVARSNSTHVSRNNNLPARRVLAPQANGLLWVMSVIFDRSP
jgi:hypothetical protein